MNNGRENGGNQGKRGWIIIAGICGVCFLGCLIWLIFYIAGNHIELFGAIQHHPPL